MGDRKRGPDSYDNGPRKESRSGTIIKMLCPFYSAGAIIGDGGKEIKSIKDDYGISIQVSKKDVRFPGTDERVITIQGECETIKKVVKHVQELIRNDQPPPSAKSVDVDANEKRKRALKLVVADTSIGRIIGKGGETIKGFKEKFTVVINTTKKHEAPANLDERIVSVEGDKEEVDSCIEEMIDTVCSDRQARMQWFVDYNNLGGGYDDGYGRPSPRKSGFGGGYDGGYGGGYGAGYGGGHDRGYDRGYGGGHDRGYGGGYDDGGYGGYSSQSRYGSSGYRR